MTIVIDASVALKWVLDEPGSDAAVALLDDELIAPALWLVEAANALWRRTRRGEISDVEATERLAELLNAPVASTRIDDDLPTAAELARTLGHPVYDCLYLAAALREETHLVTADRRFHEIVDRSPLHRGAVKLLGA